MGIAMKKVLITGGAGFIGSNLAERLLLENRKVVCVDNFLLGSRDNLRNCLGNVNFTLYEEDVRDTDKLCSIMERHGTEEVFHLAANSDIKRGGENPKIDLEHTFMTTYSVLEAMRRTGTGKLFFASTSAVYGEKMGLKLKEDMGELLPVSYYGASKLASEAAISAYTTMNGWTATIFRFANVVGPKLTHGVIYDFIQKLKKNPSHLQILGDGRQCKPYIYSGDLLDAVLLADGNASPGLQVYNAGVDSATSVDRIADMVCESMHLSGVVYEHTGGDRGWKGDVPSFRFDLDKIHAAGWTAEHTSDGAVRQTLRDILGD